MNAHQRRVNKRSLLAWRKAVYEKYGQSTKNVSKWFETLENAFDKASDWPLIVSFDLFTKEKSNGTKPNRQSHDEKKR